jgi:phosphopantetheine--protein transferase-like protein
VIAIGNDVVDLDDPQADSCARERYVARVCLPRERAWLARSADLKKSFWRVFAAKEAAYKAVSKLGPAPGFAYQRFEVAPDFRSVRFDELELQLHVTVEGSCVHAVAWLGRQPECAVLEGADARPALLRALGGDELTIEREPQAGSWGGYGAPRVMRDGQPSEYDVSLSHDGRFAAYAWAAARDA